MNTAIALRTSDGEQVGLASCSFVERSSITWPVSDRYGMSTQRRAPWLRMSSDTRRLLARLDVLSRPDADRSPAAVTPAPQALRDARTFVLSLPNGLVHLPDVGLADDGEVNFLWKDAGIHVDLGFYGCGTFSYYARDDKGHEYLEDECRAAHGLPSDLAALLTR